MNSLRQRSPRFPSYSLKDALGFAGKIYANVHRSAIDAETAFKLMGFKGRSGASSTALGSIRQFGLIEGQGDSTRVSELALTIFEPETEAEKAEALLTAFKSPDVFAQISERYSDRIPTLDEPIRAYLIRELGFSQGGADQCLLSFRDSLAYVESLSGFKDPNQVRSKAAINDEEVVSHRDNELSSRPVDRVQSNHQADFIVQLGSGIVALIQIKGGQLNANHLKKLGRFIELQAELLRDEEDDLP